MPLPKKRVLFQDFDQTSSTKRPLLNSRSPTSILKNAGATVAAVRRVDGSTETLLHDIYSSSIDFSQYSNLDMVLDAACAALAESTPKLHLQIYASLNAALRCEGTRISTQLLTEKANPLLLYAKRDLQLFESSTEKLDLRVVVQILKVVDYLFFSEEIAISLDFELVKWFLLRGLGVIENNGSSKSVTAAYLHIFNYQRLPRQMSNDMALRLLKAVTSRPNSSSVGMSSEYISTYRLLLHSNPAMMLTHVDEWLPATIRALTDSSSLVRQRALQVAQEVTSRFLANRMIGKCAIQVLESTELEKTVVVLEGEPETSKEHFEKEKSSSPRRPYIETFTQNIMSLVTTQGEGKTAMGIWSSILLMVITWGNGSADRIERWEHIGKLLEVCKLGFNSPYLSTKTATISAWRTVIYIWTAQAFSQYPSQPGLSISESLSRNITFLLHPFTKLIQESQPVIASALLASFYSFLNVSMRAPSPALQDKQWDITWDLILLPVVKRVLESPYREIRIQAVKILNHILEVRPPSPKSSNARSRLLMTGTVSLAEVPCLSGKWIKRRSSEILDLLLAMLRKDSPWEMCEKMWMVFLRSAKLALQREIYTSQETMAQVTAICNFIYACSEAEYVDFIKIAYLIRTAVESIGIVAFTEEAVQLTEHNRLVTLSHQKGAKKMGSKIDPSSPIVFLWNWLLSAQLKGSHASKVAATLVQEFLQFLSSRLSTRGKVLSLLAIFLQTSEDRESLWQVIADEAYNQFASPESISQREFEISDLFVILEWAFEQDVLPCDKTWERWSRLFVTSGSEIPDSGSADMSAFLEKLVAKVVKSSRDLDMSKRMSLELLSSSFELTASSGKPSLGDGNHWNRILDQLIIARLDMPCDSRIQQSLSSYLRSSLVDVSVKLSTLRVILQWLSCQLTVDQHKVTDLVQLMSFLLEHSQNAIDNKSDLLSVWTPVIVVGLNLQAGALFTETLDIWNTYFSKKGVVYEPFSSDLVDVVNFIKRDARVKIKTPKHFPIFAIRASSRLSRHSKSPTKAASGYKSPAGTTPPSNEPEDSPTLKRTKSMVHSSPASISSIILTPPSRRREGKSVSAEVELGARDSFSSGFFGLENQSVTEMDTQLVNDMAPDKQVKVLTPVEERQPELISIDGGTNAAVDGGHEDLAEEFGPDINMAGVNGEVAVILELSQTAPTAEVSLGPAKTMESTESDTQVDDVDTEMRTAPDQVNDVKHVDSEKVALDELPENVSEIPESVPEVPDIIPDSLGDKNVEYIASAERSARCEILDEGAEELALQHGQISEIGEVSEISEVSDVSEISEVSDVSEVNEANANAGEMEDSEVDEDQAKEDPVMDPCHEIDIQALEQDAAISAVESKVSSPVDYRKCKETRSLERRRRDWSRSPTPLPDFQVKSQFHALVPIKDMRRIDSGSDYAEGFKKRKRSPKGSKTKKGTVDLKRRRISGVERGQRSTVGDLFRVLSTIDCTTFQYMNVDECFEMETSLMDALTKVRQHAIANRTMGMNTNVMHDN